jgi:hypothetical protein
LIISSSESSLISSGQKVKHNGNLPTASTGNNVLYILLFIHVYTSLRAHIQEQSITYGRQQTESSSSKLVVA